MGLPEWYGISYPSWRDLEVYAESLGSPVVVNRTPIPAFIRDASLGGPMILIPSGLSPLESIWDLAHEVGHAVAHEGPRNGSKRKQEVQANRWAACALIPWGRIQEYQNACLDVFIGALWKHYEEFPFEDCPARRLAARIAKYRLEAMGNGDRQ